MGGVGLLGDIRLVGEPLGFVFAAGNALLVSLLPATATVIGVVVLAQIPTWAEVCGVVLVVGGVALRREPPTATAEG